MVHHDGASGRRSTKFGRLAIVAACFALTQFAPHVVGGASALTFQEEEAIDRTAGILGRPWRYAVPGMITIDYLRQQSRIRAGLPSYDQQPVEGLTPPTPEPTTTPTPEPTPTPTPTPAPEPIPTPEPKPKPTTKILKSSTTH